MASNTVEVRVNIDQYIIPALLAMDIDDLARKGECEETLRNLKDDAVVIRDAILKLVMDRKGDQG